LCNYISKRQTRMSNERLRDDAYATDKCSPRSSSNLPWYSTSDIDGLNQMVWKMPLKIRTMN
jgi:hypothetical protein